MPTTVGRGPHAADEELFAERHHAALRTAVDELSWLLERGYAEKSALQIVGDRHRLRARQRIAVRRCACAATACARRQAHRVPPEEMTGRVLAIDGFNCLIAIEAALAGGVLLRGRDRALRDLASVHGSYRRVETTERAIELIGTRVVELGVTAAVWYLDRPVSNSGRLRELLLAASPRTPAWTVELPFDPDRILRTTDAVVASGDSSILDACGAWIDLAAEVVAHAVPGATILDLA
jgi:hypothetical protein